MDRMTAQLPHTPKNWSYLLLALLFIAGLFIVVIAAEQHMVDAQYITADVLKQSVQQVESYSAEATLLSQYTHQRAAPRPYVAAYGSSLQEASDSIAQKLTEHPHDDSLDAKVAAATALSSSLSNYLHQLTTEPTDQLAGSTAWFQHISKAAQQLEQSL